MIKDKAIVAAFAALAMLCGCSSRMSMTVPESELKGMTEAKAIMLTRTALQHAGIDATLFVPVPFRHHSSALFASNAIDPDTGYVLWQNTNRLSGLAYDFTVDIRRAKGNAVITVRKPK